MGNRPIKVRFAPSPTGDLHVGNIRTALFDWAYARHTGGTFLFRIEDTDRSRVTDEYIAAAIDTLKWLGLNWDEGPEVGGHMGHIFNRNVSTFMRSGPLVLLNKVTLITATAPPKSWKLVAKRKKSQVKPLVMMENVAQ